MANVTIQYTADITQLNAKLDQIIQKQEQIGSSAKKAGADMSDAAGKAANKVEGLGSVMGKLGIAVTVAFAVRKIISFTKELISVERHMELLQNRLNFLAGGADMGEQMFLRLEATSRRLGLSIVDTAEGLASFGIAAKQAGFSAQKSEKIFIQVATGLRAAGASSLQTQRAFYALQQMMSKGVVAAEELRRQLGESLPGASDLMTKAYNRLHPAANLTNLEFTKLLETGKIISKDILPVFAAVIEETFAPALAGKQNSLDAALNKVSNEILKLKLNIGNASWFKAGANFISEGLEEINAALSSEKLSVLEKFNAILFAGSSEAAQKAFGAYNSIQSALEEYNNKVSQAITTNIVFGNALEKHSAKYKALTEEDRDLYKKRVDNELEANKNIIKSAEQLLKENDKLIEAKKKEFEEGIKVATQGKTKIQAYAIEQKMLKDLSEEIRNITKNRTDGEAKAAENATYASNRNEYLQASLIEFYNLDEELRKKSQDDKEAADKAEQKRLEDEVARAEKRVLETQKGSIEENKARANLAEKQKDLNVFMAKSDAAMQLERLKGELKTNEQLEEARRKTADAMSQDVVEDEVDPSKDPNLKAIDKLLETYRKNQDEMSQAIAAPFMSAMEKEQVAAASHYISIKKTFDESINAKRTALQQETKDGINELNSRFEKNLIFEEQYLTEGIALRDAAKLKIQQLNEESADGQIAIEESLQQELDNIRQRAADKERRRDDAQIMQVARMVSRVGGEIAQMSQSFAEADREIMKNSLDASMQALSARLAAGLISEQDYQDGVNAIKRKQFKITQDEAIAKAQIDTGLAIINLFTQMPPLVALGFVPIMLGIADKQITAIKSAVMPTFHDGGIDIGGNTNNTGGPLKSDEFIAKLQKGESVIDRQDTRMYKDELSAIRNGKFEDYIASKYILPALERSHDRKQSTSNSTSMEMAFQAAEMVNAIKGNKVIKLHKSSIKELTSNSGARAADKIIARRSWR